MERLTEIGFLCLDYSKEPKEQALASLKDAFGIVVRSRFTLDKELLSPLKNLKKLYFLMLFTPFLWSALLK